MIRFGLNQGQGYVVDPLEAALWAFHRSDSFREGALLAVHLGDDADTTAAIYGQLAGAFYSAEGIPAEWNAALALRELIIELSNWLTAFTISRIEIAFQDRTQLAGD